MKKKGIEIPSKLSAAATKTLKDEGVSKSAKIKMLFDLGYDVKEISTLLDIRYNFAYNVISNYVNIENIEVENNRKDSKKDKIIELFLEGKSNKEIAKIMKSNYNYVYNVIKKYKNEHKEEKNEKVEG